MKRLISLFVLSFLCTYIDAHILLSDIYWIKSDNVYVTTKSNAYITLTYYSKQKFENWYAKDDVEIKYWFKDSGHHRETVSFGNYKSKLIKTPKTVKVRGFANVAEQLAYDTYVVEIKDVLYYLPAKYVSDNSVIDSYVEKLSKPYNLMISQYENYEIDCRRHS